MDDVLLVLGAAVWPGGVPSPTLTRRTEWATRLFRKGRYRKLILSGGIGRYPPSEAQVMARIAEQAGIPASVLILDEAARTTIDTARFAASLPDAQALCFVAVTDLYHAPRTWLALRAYGLRARVSYPPIGRATSLPKLTLSFLREAPALGLYFYYFLKIRLSRDT